MKRSKRIPQKLLLQVLRKDNEELEEDAKKIVNEMSAENLKFSRLMSQLSKHADSPTCRAHFSLKKEFWKLQKLCGLQESNTFDQQADSTRDTQAPATEVLETGVFSDTNLGEIASFGTTNQVQNASTIEPMDYLSEPWLSLTSGTGNNVTEDQDPAKCIVPNEEDYFSQPVEAQRKAVTTCENVVDVLNFVEAESDLKDFFDQDSTFSHSFEVKNSTEILPQSNDIAFGKSAKKHQHGNHATHLQRTKLTLNDFEVKLKYPSLLHDCQYQTNTDNDIPAAINMQTEPTNNFGNHGDVCSENFGWRNQDSPTALDINLLTVPEINENQSVSSTENPTHCSKSVTQFHQPNIMFRNEKNNSSETVQVENDASSKDINFTVDQNINCTDDIIYYEINSKKLEEDVNQIEPVEEDFSAFLDIHQAKQNRTLKNDMHNLYVGTAPSPDPDLSATLTSTQRVELLDMNTHSYHNIFIKTNLAEHGNTENFSYGLEGNEIDFYTQFLNDEDCVVS